MSQLLFKTDGLPGSCVIQQDGQDMRFVTGLTFRQGVGEVSRVEVDYSGAAFHVEHTGAKISCAGTGLDENGERAVLAYLQDKYRE